ncbi:DUF1868 domain-containing protein (plasmid) [Ralstonia sp. 25C]|uniref:DUF1868 domain-containing protein n=1 Tax=Ralstonia sp. 25C TaxID=3447363 RepID=UPI003F754726
MQDTRMPASVLPDVHPAGLKFHRDGTVRRFPGNTILCHVPRPSALWNALVAVRDQLSDSGATEHLTFLPPESYHMTVFEGATDHTRTAGFWPADLPPDTPLGICTRHLERKLTRFDIGCELPLRMTIAEPSLQVRAGVIALTPVDDAEHCKLRILRDRLSEHLAIRHPTHDAYVFHITLAYPLTAMTPEDTAALLDRQAACAGWLRRQVPVFELGPPAFCTFNDMHAFVPRLVLGHDTIASW